MILLEDRLDPYPLGKSAFKPLLAQQENLLVPDYLKDLYTSPGLILLARCHLMFVLANDFVEHDLTRPSPIGQLSFKKRSR